MRFNVRSLGGKLIFSAVLTLLLCLLLFSVASWYVLRVYYEREANSAAATHLTLIRSAYQDQTAVIFNLLTNAINKTGNASLKQALTHPPTRSSSQQIAAFLQSNKLAGTAYISHVSKNLDELVQTSGDISAGPGKTIPRDIKSLIQAALHGRTISALVMRSTEGNSDSGWDIDFAIPVNGSHGSVSGVLVASQHLDDQFASNLVKASGNTSLDVLLCESQQILGTTIQSSSFNHLLNGKAICEPGAVKTVDADQPYLTTSIAVGTRSTLVDSSLLHIVDVEPLYNLSAFAGRAIALLVALAISIIALGVAFYMVITRTFFIHPIRRLQSHVASLVPESADILEQHAPLDELSMLAHSFNLLSESLNIQESETNAITSRMSDLLAMSDILISTLNLEDLLKEIVSRLGIIMHVKSVSLLLYGREMLSPWAVAHWQDTMQSNGHMPTASLPGAGSVTVHADPAGDITMASTTKMAAIPPGGARPAPVPISNGTGKRRAIRAHRLTAPPEPYGLRRPRIPRPVLRDLDMLLARMAMQKQKIVYGEDVNAIYRERRETWAQLALETGYQSVVAVPLFLQDRAIGAVMLYGDRPQQISGRDTFLLSTAAIQSAMAIQNVLLFGAVNDKNAALERVNHLKSQFLATVTHELRTPLHSIISYGSLILEGYLDGDLTQEQQDHIQFIVRRAEDLSRLVDDMLDLSKIEADKLEVKVEPLSLDESLQDVVNELKQLASNKGLTLALEMNEDLPMALADSHRIRQVIINMVSNALKFTEKGGVTIRCSLLERYDMLRISVSDTGIGISPAALDYIFEAFRQADGSTTRRFGGTGLGLTIARKLIELQGGEVAVESIVGQGSTFSFTLPVAAHQRVHFFNE